MGTNELTNNVLKSRTVLFKLKFAFKKCGQDALSFPVFNLFQNKQGNKGMLASLKTHFFLTVLESSGNFPNWFDYRRETINIPFFLSAICSGLCPEEFSAYMEARQERQ